MADTLLPTQPNPTPTNAWSSPNVVAAGVQTGSDFLSSLTNGLFNYFSQKRQHKYNKELQELAYQQNIEQWERENAYNHPAEQMKRLIEAGLNPNLVYGNGSAVQTSAHSPQLQYYHEQAPHVAPMTLDMLGRMAEAVQINKLQADTVKTEQEAWKAFYQGKTESAKYIGQLIQNDIAQFDLEYAGEMKMAELAIKIAEEKLISKKIETESEQVEYLKAQTATEKARARDIANRFMMDLGKHTDYYDITVEKDEAGNIINVEMQPNVWMTWKRVTDLVSSVVGSLGGLIESVADVKDIFMGIRNGADAFETVTDIETVTDEAGNKIRRTTTRKNRRK